MSSLDSSSVDDESISLGGSQTEQDWTTLDPTLEQSSVADYAKEKATGLYVSVALPPSLSTERSKNEIALTGSAALDVLDQLLANNEIGKERAAKLRRKYNELRDNLETSRQLENTLLMDAKSLEHKLAHQKKVLEKGANFPDSDSTESGRLRQSLLTHQNELDQTEERTSKLEQEIALLTEELNQVEKEYSRQPKREEIEQRMRELVRARDDLNSEVEKRDEDIRRLKEDLDKKNFKISIIRQETDEMLQVEELLQGELIEIRNRPSIPKEIDTIKTKQREVQENINCQLKELEELQPQISEGEHRISKLNAEVGDLAKELKDMEQRNETGQINLDLLNKDLNTAKEREATLHEDRATLELQWKHRCQEFKGLYESLAKKTKEKERELKSLKKAEVQLNALTDQMEQVGRKKIGLEDKKTEKEERVLHTQMMREEITREVEAFRQSVAQAAGICERDNSDAEKLYLMEQRYKAEIKRHLAILHDLNKEFVAMTKSRDQDAKEFHKTQRQKRVIFDDLRTKEAEIDEHKKKISELQMQLKDFAAAYEVVKTERNKIHSHIQLLQQVGAELAEKSKVLQNETEILRTTSVTKERLLQKCSLVTTAKVLERDTQRQELTKLKLGQVELHSELEASREEISKLTQQINSAEQQLSRLRRRYEQSVQDRNDLGLQLIERNEEVCVFYERMNVQESQLRRANMELSAREEEIRFLKMEISRLQNEILVSRKSVPVKDKLELDLVNAQIELKTCQKSLQQLEEAVECASDPSRLRLLRGDNPSRSELTVKITDLEGKLSQSEQQLLEKELLFEQVCKLTDRADRRVDSQKESTLSVAKKVNMYQAKIKESNRKLMALVSELSMTQAKAINLQQDCKEAELSLEQAYTRLANGEPPDEECKNQWEKTIKQKERKKEEEFVRRKFQDAEEAHTLPSGTISHAEPRPNAYMPLGEDDLPIPKPYGNHAPFKPSQPGANLRHIRKPVPKPIDI